MIVKAPDEKFPTAPEGSFSAVCVDELDLGIIKSSWGGEERERHMVRLVWQIHELDPEDKRYLVKQDYTASLDEKAKLRKHLQAWRGRVFTPGELMGFDLANVVGVPCMVSIVHASGRKGGTFANVDAVMKLPKGMEPIKASGYIRVKDRKAEAAPAPKPPRPAPKPPEEREPDYALGVSDDDIPF